MSITVLVPTALQRFTANQEALTIEGKNVKDALSSLVGKHPELKQHLFNEKGELRSFVNIYLNDEDIRHQQDQQTKLNEGDTITIVPSIAGGAGAGPDGPKHRAVPNSDRVRGGSHRNRGQVLLRK